jgi:alkaline phosphatase
MSGITQNLRRKLSRTLLLCTIAVITICPIASAAPAKNVILMISDGAGFNTFDCASYYQHGQRGKQVYDKFPIRLGCTTYSADNQDGYEPDKFWSEFKYARKHPTDSAAAATALYTGAKTKNGRLCTDRDGKKLTTIAEFADSVGKSTGTISSVMFSHATPGAVWAHNDSRDEYEQIAREMICDSGLDVIMGCGHPRYDNNWTTGKPNSVAVKIFSMSLSPLQLAEAGHLLTAGMTSRRLPLTLDLYLTVSLVWPDAERLCNITVMGKVRAISTKMFLLL